MAFLRDSWTTVRTFGVRGLRRRLRYEAELRAGILRRRTPVAAWEAVAGYDGEILVPWVRPVGEPEEYRRYLETLGVDAAAIVREGEEILAGRIRYFSGPVFDVGFPPRWHAHALTGAEFPADCHWTQVPDLSPTLGDIKTVWEPSRFTFGHTLARAYAATGDERFAEGFWQAFESWMAANPPNRGPNWKCGQETSLRMISWLLATAMLEPTSATTPERKRMLGRALLASVHRVEANITYALSQRNNHGLSEAIGLLTGGIVLARHPRAAHWRKTGARLLRELVREQFAADGGYIQQSLNYHRLALDLLSWTLLASRAANVRLADDIRDAVRRSADFLSALLDPATGELPNYGANDGARLFALASSDYPDFRPSLQLAGYALQAAPPFPAGAHDEIVLWLSGVDSMPHGAASTPPPVPSLRAETSGYYTLRGPDSCAFLRATTYRTRPSQCDNLHVDLRVRGVNLAFDPGTYSYNSPPPWNNSLVSTAVHNVAAPQGREQMRRGSRFLWYDWVSSTKIADFAEGDVEYVEFEHDAFLRGPVPVRQRRGVFRFRDAYVVLDALEADADLSMEMGWNLDLPAGAVFREAERRLEGEVGGLPYSITIASFPAVEWRLIQGGADTGPAAWISRRYLERKAAWRLQGNIRSRLWHVVTVFGGEEAVVHPDGVQFLHSGQRVKFSVGWQPGTSGIVNRATVSATGA